MRRKLLGSPSGNPIVDEVDLMNERIGEYPDIDERWAQKLREKQELEMRSQEVSLLNAFRHGMEVEREDARKTRWHDLGFAFLLGALAGFLIAGAMTWIWR